MILNWTTLKFSDWQILRNCHKYNKILKTWEFILLFILLLFNSITPGYALDITLQWAKNNESNLAGYKVYYRDENQSYDFANPYLECIEPICTIYDLYETKTYYFVVRAFDTSGYESANSNETCLIEGIPAIQTSATYSGSGGSGGGCFIATAAYGSLMESHVRILCDFRDRFLLTNGFGKTFVHVYYKYSPPVADFIEKNDILRAMVRASLLPLVLFSWFFLKIGVRATTLLLASLFIFCVTGYLKHSERSKYLKKY